MQAPVITVSSSAGKRRLLLTGEEPVTIGRDATNSLSFPDDERLSRFHCAIERRHGRFYLRDLGSDTGTRVNGQVVEDHALQPDDRVKVGEVSIRYRLSDIDPKVIARVRGEQASSPSAIEPADEATAASASEPPGRETGPDADNDRPLELAPEAPAPVSIRRAPSLQQPQREPAADEGEDPDAALTRAATKDARGLSAVMRQLPSLPFDDSDIRLYNARGQAVAQPTARSAAEAVKQRRDGVMFFRALLTICFQARATDLHVEPDREGFNVRLRIDGLMAPLTGLHAAIGQRMLRVVKVLADIDIAQSKAVQEGHFTCKLPDRYVDFRVSFTPAVRGQKLVVRVLDPANAPQGLDALGMPEWMHRELAGVLRQDSGMVLVCGPTGSGKTSSLYAMIRQIDRSTRNVVAIEDPVEYQLDNVTQLPVDEAGGNTFASLLRSVLRQDPDVLLVGEIRDAETARIAMQAATTGHLVFSTVHATDTIGAIFRLRELNVEPYHLASGLNHVLAQRLVRVLCPHCKLAQRPTAGQMTRLSRHGVKQIDTIYEPVGCARCMQTGYRGRRGIFELMTANDELRDAVMSGGRLKDIRRAMRNSIFTTLHDAACELIADGETSIDEVERVIGRS